MKPAQNKPKPKRAIQPEKVLERLLKKAEANKKLSSAEEAQLDAIKQTLPATTVTNKADLARVLNESRQLINEWSKEEDFPKADSAGRYNVDAITKWRNARGIGTNKTPTYQAEKTRNLTIRNDILDIQRKLKTREVISIETVKETFARSIVTFKTKFLTIPAKLSQRFALETDPVVIEQAIKAACVEALAEMQNSEWAKLICPHCKESIDP